MDHFSKLVLQQLVDRWGEVESALHRLNQATEVLPGPYDIFQPVEAGGGPLEFAINPVVFKLPERAGHVSSDLFVVVKGSLSFERAPFVEDRTLATERFASQVAYFRQAAHRLKHVYGAHYDLEFDRVGHPFFHAQIRSYEDFAQYVFEHYEAPQEVVDNVRGMLGTVRVPVAQMDVFSVFLQLCADHLLGASSGREEHLAFEFLKGKLEFFRGAGSRNVQFATDDASRCYRAWRWYPSPAA